MSKRRTYHWPQLLAQFEQSGLSQVEFCKQHHLSPKYFSLRRSKHNALTHDSAFATVLVTPEPAIPQGLIVEVGLCKIHCPTSLSIPSLVALVKAFA